MHSMYAAELSDARRDAERFEPDIVAVGGQIQGGLGKTGLPGEVRNSEEHELLLGDLDEK